MSLYHINLTKTITLNGIKYNADFNTDININFSASNYKINIKEDANGTMIELIPGNMDFLHEITNIFPTSEYDIKFSQGVYKHTKPHVSLYFNIHNRNTGEKVHFAEGAILTDTDYDYMRNVLITDVPQYEWQSAEDYIRSEIISYLKDGSGYSLLTPEAWDLLDHEIAVRYKEVKTAGYVDFNCDLADDLAKEIIEEALREHHSSPSIAR